MLAVVQRALGLAQEEVVLTKTMKQKDTIIVAGYLEKLVIVVQRELPFEGTPVLSDAEFERASEEIRAITSEAGQPVLA